MYGRDALFKLEGKVSTSWPHNVIDADRCFSVRQTRPRLSQGKGALLAGAAKVRVGGRQE